jgi:hypothetical protein
MTKTEFIDWKSNPITKQVFNELRMYIDGLQAELGQAAGVDSIADARRVGAIQAYKDLLEIDFDEESQE